MAETWTWRAAWGATRLRGAIWAALRTGAPGSCYYRGRAPHEHVVTSPAPSERRALDHLPCSPASTPDASLAMNDLALKYLTDVELGQLAVMHQQKDKKKGELLDTSIAYF